MGVTFDDPTFADIDFGFDHTALDTYDSVCRGVYPKARIVRRQLSQFIGCNGAFLLEFGVGPRDCTWDILTFYNADSNAVYLEGLFNQYLNQGTWAASWQGNYYYIVQLKEWYPIGPVVPIIDVNRTFGREYALTFEVLDP